MADFRENLRKLRTDNSLTQEELSKKLNVSPSTISQYENGIREPGISQLINIAKTFNVSVDYLLGLTNIKELDSKQVSDIAKKVVRELINKGLIEPKK